MYNLRKINGSFKGTIGECMFKMTRKWAILPRFFSKQKYFTIYRRHLTESQLNFIKDNWYSIDAIEVIFEKRKKEVILYEVKTKNKYAVDLAFMPKMTLSTHQVYNKAKELGFIVKLAIVELHENWEYTINLMDFSEEKYCIDTPKKYDKVLEGP
ncbi:hypothetical protein HY837_06450 [archaeon]|nr:hypothetical protein [archaeon]